MDMSADEKISSYLIQSQEEEMKRIALDLHEGVGQTLYSLLTGLQYISTGLTETGMKEYVQDMAAIMERTIHEVRLLSVEIHPPTLTTLGFLPALKSYTKLYTSTFGVVVHLQTTGSEQSISERHSVTVFRVCQEALANVAKYAEVAEVGVSLQWEKNRLNISIVDSGKGFDVELAMKRAKGLAVMKERMLLVGGDIQIRSQVDSGTSIEVSIPL